MANRSPMLNLRLSIGDRLAIYSPRNLEEMEKHKGKEEEVAILPDDYVVRGIFDVGYYEYNANVIVTSLRNAQDLYQALGPGYRISIWSEENSQILTALAVEKNVMFVIILIVMVVAAFGIMGTLIAFVVRKTREIGILKAVGAANGQIMALFLGQSVFVGLFGIFSGFSLAMLALAYRNEFLHFMNRWTGL